MAAHQVDETVQQTGRAVQRRGLIAGAAALVAGIVAKAASVPVVANDGDIIHVGQFLTGTQPTGLSLANATAPPFAMFNVSNSGQAVAIGADTSGSTSAATTAVRGTQFGSLGVGVTGSFGSEPTSPASGTGVYGFSTDDVGVFGRSTSTSGTGVIGESTSIGVEGRIVNNPAGSIGVKGSGETGVSGNSGTGTGVSGGGVTGVSGSGVNTGVQGQVSGTGGVGVHGTANVDHGVGCVAESTSFVGLWGQTNSGTAVLGDVIGGGSGTSNTAVQGRVGVFNASSQPNTVAVQGLNQSTGAGAIGVAGTCTVSSGTGVAGSSGGAVGDGNGVWGYVTHVGKTHVVAGVFGQSPASYGMIGYSTAPQYSGCTGIATVAGTAAFAGGTTTAGAFAAYFTGPVVVDGDFTVVDPTRKHGAIKHPDGSYRLLYSMESPESWVEDFGKGQLVGGRASVTLDKEFAAIADTNDYHVFLTTYGATNGLDVVGQTATGFEVQERNKGTSGARFGYRVVAQPKAEGKGQRLAPFAMPQIKIPKADEMPKPPQPPAPSVPPAPARVPKRP
jgi:hypothetical protein